MPIYDYQCCSCNSTFELFVRLPNASSQDAVLACPSCQSTDLQQCISGFSVSSAGTRQLNLDRARKLGSKEQRDRTQAEWESNLHHHD
jgi:putative FmdB family regulatory protein